MSGIAGIIHFDGRPVEPGLIERMTGTMPYRGPDGIRHWVRGAVALGQCMLRTTPESLEETQPLANEDESLVLVMDGRVDNWEELRSELLARGARLRTRADAELVLRAYEAWGEDCLPHIDGDFALVIWDARRRRAFCARDRIGNKPLVYHWDGKTLVFASELRAILEMPWVPRLLNEGMLVEFLAMEWLSRDETPWQGVLRLPPAHCCRFQPTGRALDRYWQPDYRVELPPGTDDDQAEHYRCVLTEQIRRMSRSHEMAAYEVSGGLDSSAIFALATELDRNGRLLAPSLAGYSLHFTDDSNADEIAYCRSLANHLGCKIAEVPPSRMPLAWYVSSAKHYREIPNYPNGSMALKLRRTARADGSRTIMTGVGGDEWIGMPRPAFYYEEELALHNWRNVANCLLHDAKQEGLRYSIWHFLRHGVAPLLPGPLRKVRRRLFGNQSDKKERWLSQKAQSIIADRRAQFKDPIPRLPRRGQLFQLTMLRDPYSCIAREQEERMCGRLGLELRSPFQTRAVVELAFATPERYRSRGNTTKWLHRRAMKDHLPEDIVHRSTKADFMGIFRCQLKSIGEDEIQAIASRQADRVDPAAIMRIYERMVAQGSIAWEGWLLWTLIASDALAETLSSRHG